MPRVSARGRRRLVLALTLLLAPLVTPVPVRADEPLFGFIQTVDLLPKGKFEVEQWATYRYKKAWGDFHVLENRTEFSYGITDAFQLSAYANWNWTTSKKDGTDRKQLVAETFAPQGVGLDPDKRFTDTRFIGVSLEGIWRLLSPYTDPVGLGILLEPTFGPDLVEFESRLLLQKNFFDDRLVIAFNFTLAQELRQLPGDNTAPPGTDEATRHWDRETDLNLGLAVSYRFARNWSAGWEFINEREFSELIFWQGKYATNDAYYTGPTLHYGGKSFFFTLTGIRQLPIAQDFANKGAASQVRGGINYADDFEKYRVRVKLGFYF